MNIQFFHLCRAVSHLGDHGASGPREVVGTVVMLLSWSLSAARPNAELFEIIKNSEKLSSFSGFVYFIRGIFQMEILLLHEGIKPCIVATKINS